MSTLIEILGYLIVILLIIEITMTPFILSNAINIKYLVYSASIKGGLTLVLIIYLFYTFSLK